MESLHSSFVRVKLNEGKPFCNAGVLVEGDVNLDMISHWKASHGQAEIVRKSAVSENDKASTKILSLLTSIANISCPYQEDHHIAKNERSEQGPTYLLNISIGLKKFLDFCFRHRIRQISKK